MAGDFPSTASAIRRIGACFLSVCLLAGLTGCSSTVSSASRSKTLPSSSIRSVPSRPPRSPSSLTIGYVGVGDTEGERAEQMERSTIRGLRATGIRVMTFRSLSLNPQPQITAAQAFADKGIDALVVDPQFSNVWGDAFATIRDQGIKVVLLDRLPLGMAQSRYDAYLGSNYSQLGTHMSQWVLGRLGRWTTANQTYEYGGTPRSLIVSSLLGSAPDNQAVDGWTDEAGWKMDTVETVAVGEVRQTAIVRLEAAWNRCALAGTLPHVIFATNQTAASATIDFLARAGVRTVQDPAEAMQADARRRPRQPWAVAVVALAGRGWISSHERNGKLAAGIAMPTDYSSRLVSLLSKLCADIPTAKDDVVPGSLLIPKAKGGQS